MPLLHILSTATSATFEVANGEPYRSPSPHRAAIDGKVVYTGDRNVFTVRGLAPATTYRLDLGACHVAFRTEHQSARLDVRECGAVGDGIHDDTAALQAALCACPKDGTVLLPPGEWLSGPLFLADHVELEIARGARLIGHPDIARWPVIPGIVKGSDGAKDTYLGRWEGTPADCHAALLTGIGVRRVRVHGEGVVDGNASFSTWWSRPKTRFVGWRPRLLHFIGCEDIAVEGLTLRNSPSWTVHPQSSRRLVFAALRIEAPVDSPNTDGINPDSCEDVTIAGVHITTGDDCIALKSGKAWIAERDPGPTRRVRISNCLMEHGHGAVVIGSEMSGGIYDVQARDCLFVGTDRGLRIKTRRGRGRHAIVDGLLFENIRMQGVGTPFVVNSFYWCDPDGREPHVGDRNARPVDDGTPTIRNITLEHIDCAATRHSAGFVLGLPERPVENLVIRDYRVQFAPDADAGEPDMAEGITPVARQGFVLTNVRGLTLEALRIEHADGAEVIKENAA